MQKNAKFLIKPANSSCLRRLKDALSAPATAAIGPFFHCLSQVSSRARLVRRQDRDLRLSLAVRFIWRTKPRCAPLPSAPSDPTRPGACPFFAPIGAEPPIDAKGERPGTDTHRRVSLRWLAGTGLTGLIGAGLLGGAIYAAFDREANFAEAPTRALLARKEQPEDASVNPRKGDRIVRGLDMVAAKQTFKTPTTIKVGDREVIRNRAFTRVSTTLTLSDTGLGADVPDFNPLQMLADSSNPAPDVQDAPDVAPTQDDPEVSFNDSDLAQVSLSAQSGTLSLDEVRAQVAETVKSAQARGNKAPLPLPPQLLLMRTSRAGLDVAGAGLAYATPGVSNSNSPFSSIEVRMVPENVTLAPKSAPPQADAAHPAPAAERLLVVRHGEGLDDILGRRGRREGCRPRRSRRHSA